MKVNEPIPHTYIANVYAPYHVIWIAAISIIYLSPLPAAIVVSFRLDVFVCPCWRCWDSSFFISPTDSLSVSHTHFRLCLCMYLRHYLHRLYLLLASSCEFPLISLNIEPVHIQISNDIEYLMDKHEYNVQSV